MKSDREIVLNLHTLESVCHVVVLHDQGSPDKGITTAGITVLF